MWKIINQKAKDFFENKEDRPLYIYQHEELIYLTHSKSFTTLNPNAIVKTYSYSSEQYFIEIDDNYIINDGKEEELNIGESLIQGLNEALKIEQGKKTLVKKPNMPATTFVVKD